MYFGVFRCISVVYTDRGAGYLLIGPTCGKCQVKASEMKRTSRISSSSS